MKKILLSILLFSIVHLAFSQIENTSPLTIKQIMQGEDFVGYSPQSHRWAADGKSILFNWNPDHDTLRSSYRADIATSKITKLSVDEIKALPENGSFNRDYSKSTYVKNGDLFLMDMIDFSSQQITNTVVSESQPQFSGDEKNIIYKSDNNLFAWNITNGLTNQLTNFNSGDKKEDKKGNEMRQWLEQDQLAYFDFLKERKEKNDSQKYRNEQTKSDRPLKIFYGKKRLLSMTISPDMGHVVFQLAVPPPKDKTIVPDYVTTSGYTRELNARSKVGTAQPKYETWIYNIKHDTIYQIKADDLQGIYDKPLFLKDYLEHDTLWSDTYKNPRDVVIHLPFFSNGGKAIVVVRSQDHKDRWITQLSLENGTLKLLDRQHDDAWIGGPGISDYNSYFGNVGWLDEEHIWYHSEATGFSHLYRQNVITGKKKALTSGKFEIGSAQLSRDKKTFFITAGVESPHIRHFYHLPAKGGKMKKITSLKGGYSVKVSPNEKMLAIRFSTAKTPWELYAMPNKARATMTKLTTSTNKEFREYPWRNPEIIQFKARDNVMVPARLYQPVAGKRNGGAIVFVHGAGYLQNVHSWWSRYYREYMFHNLLVDNGYTVLDIDYRASAGYGRDWRTGIYRYMGGKDLDDQVDGAKYLVEKLGCNSEKLGIYGGSYGGFITLMAMFNAPGTFKSGAALRSVTDWAHYNHGYTSNILNTPVEDSIAYARSSPIYHAENFEGNLLMLHGMVDTNVHFQDVVRLSQRLIELEKEHWELAIFPMEGHGFREASSWTDEYRRIFELFQRTLR